MYVYKYDVYANTYYFLELIDDHQDVIMKNCGL